MLREKKNKSHISDSAGLSQHSDCLNKYGLFRRVSQRRPIFSEKNLAAWLQFTTVHLNKPQDFQNNVLQRDKDKVKMFGHVLQKLNTAYQNVHLITTVNHGGEEVMIWVCFVATAPGNLAVFESIMNSFVCQSTLDSNIQNLQQNA